DQFHLVERGAGRGIGGAERQGKFRKRVHFHGQGSRTHDGANERSGGKQRQKEPPPIRARRRHVQCDAHRSLLVNLIPAQRWPSSQCIVQVRFGSQPVRLRQSNTFLLLSWKRTWRSRGATSQEGHQGTNDSAAGGSRIISNCLGCFDRTAVSYFAFAIRLPKAERLLRVSSSLTAARALSSMA